MSPDLRSALNRLSVDVRADSSRLAVLFWLRAYTTLAVERGTTRLRWAKLSGFVSRTAREFGINGLDHAPGRALLTDYPLFQAVGADDVPVTDPDALRALDLPRSYEIELLPAYQPELLALDAWIKDAWDALRRASGPDDSLTAILARWAPIGQSGLLPALIEAQERYGWLSRDTLVEISRGLNVPLSETYGVADFYSHLYTHPVGKTFVRVCDDVPCFLTGSDSVCAAVSGHLGLAPGETTADAAFSYETVGCLGHCDHAPVVMIGHTVHEHVAPDAIPVLIASHSEQSSSA